MSNNIKAKEYAGLPYTIMTSVDETTEGNTIHVARAMEIEGCFGQGNSREEAIEDLRLAMVDFIESLLDDGLNVPEPTRLVSVSTNSSSVASYIFSGYGKNLKPVEQKTNIDPYLYTLHG
jgi:predicted RNase H-like HicB family nuclease